MPLSRLENFLINTDGNILYVNPSDLDATDAFDNKGNSLTRPFVTIQRALLEAARFSYQAGDQNDRYDKTTILLYPGTHYIDNRPGYYINNVSSVAKYYDVNENEVAGPNVELSASSNIDLNSVANIFHKFNSVEGGVIVPKGTSIVGLDLRKTKVKPLYVPDPKDIDIASSAIFRVTGGCYFWQFSVFDADRDVYFSYDFSEKGSPSRSHHKLTCFEYCDGINVTNKTGLTDLAMYYYKVMNAYGSNTGNRAITDYPGADDFEPNSPEYKIVGDLSDSDIPIVRATAANTIATVETNIAHGLNVDDTVRVTGISSDIYNGSKVVSGITSATKFTYLLPSIPLSLSETPSNGRIIIEPDNVTGASPYVFNCSLRSVYGMGGLHADGNKATGFKSMVVAQFTGIGLQKDDDAFLIYNSASGLYNDKNAADQTELPLYINQEAVYNPSYESSHIRASNDAFIQAVSTFAIGFSKHFVSIDGSDQSITNSNSNFGSKSLVSGGFKKKAFSRDDTGYVTHLVPPKDLQEATQNIAWKTLDATTTVGVASTAHLYLLGETDQTNPPSNVVNGYRIGSKNDEKIYLNVNIGGTSYTYSSPVLMQIPGNTDGPTARKTFIVETVNWTSGSDSLTLTENHNFIAGESVRVYSDNGSVPDGLENEAKYYVITTGTANVIKLAKTPNDATAGTPKPIDIKNANGGILSIVSYVTDKLPGDIGHPIQWDNSQSNWYVIGSASTTSNSIYHGIVGYSTDIQAKNSAVYAQRKSENRDLDDRIYKLRYVVPKEFANAKAPEKNYVLQESSTVTITNTEDTTVNSIKSNRNPRIIAGISTSNLVATVTSEQPHRLSTGDRILIKNVKSTENVVGTDNVGYNGYYYVTSIPSSKTFTYNVEKASGDFTSSTAGANNVNRTAEILPTFSRNEYDTSYTIQNVQTVQEYVSDQQDGIYYLTCVIGNISPTASQFTSRIENNVQKGSKFKQNILNLYPTVDTDNLDVDPVQGISVANNKLIGKVQTNNSLNSITKEGIIEYLKDNQVGYAVTGAVSTGTAGVSTVYSNINHNLNAITGLTLSVAGSGYGPGSGTTTLYGVKLVNQAGGLTGEDATAKVHTNNGAITSVQIMDGGAAYGVGNTMRVDYAGGLHGVVTVASIKNNVGDVLQVVGVGTDKNRTNSGYNGLWKITSVPSAKTVTYNSGTNPGIYTANPERGMFYVVDKAITISSISGVANTTLPGIVTLTASDVHGLMVGNKIKLSGITGTAATIYNKDFIVVGVGSTTQFTIKPDIGVTTTTGSPEFYKYGIAALGQDTSLETEKIGGSLLTLNSGIEAKLSTNITATTDPITVDSTVGFSTGDFLQIDNEIMRIKRVTSATQFTTINDKTSSRGGVLGTKPNSHSLGSFVRKIKVIPSEVRRFSSIRASGHTFEYLGYGPGNYSTALPQRHTRAITAEEELIAISTEEKGGVVFYSGMNDRGDYFTGDRLEPRENFLGGDSTDGTAIFDDVYIRNTLRVGGGPNRNLPSEFRGPVNFTNKITSTAADGIEAIKLLLKGNPTQNPSLQVGPDADPSLLVNEITQNVGIKTDNPAYELDVNGTIRANIYENFKLSDLPNNTTEEVTFGRNKVLKVNNEGNGYELVDVHELDAYKLRSFGVSDDGAVYVGTASTVGSKTRISGITTTKFFTGERVKVFGLGGYSDTKVVAPTGSVTRIPATEADMGPRMYNYWIAQYHFTSGNIGTCITLNDNVGVAQTIIGNFNDSKHISLTLSRADTGHGILVYRQDQAQGGIATNIDQSKLVGILGPKELGSATSGISWKDYGTFEQTEWSSKGTSNEYDSDQIHFPNIGTTGHGRGWVIDTIAEVGSGYIGLSSEYGTNANVGFTSATATVKVVHDSTYGLSQAIDAAVADGGNYLDIPAGTYLTQKLIIPSNFTLKGIGKNTIIKQQYFANDEFDGGGNALTFDGNFVGIGTTVGPNATNEPKDVTLQDITIDGNSGNNINYEFASQNYLVYTPDLRSALFKGIEIRNSPGGGLYVGYSERVSVENSAFVDGSLTDRFPFKPLVASGSTSFRVNDCLFENYPSSIDVSATSVVSTGGNIIRNCGTGIDAYATGKITTTNNIILGPSDEWVPSPDIYDSDWNSINISIPANTHPLPDWFGPVMLYVEDGIAKNISSTKVDITAGIGTMVGLYSTTTQPTLGTKFVDFEVHTQDVRADLIDREHGYLQLKITNDVEMGKLVGFQTGLGYEVIGTEFMDKPVGYTTYVGIGTGKWGTNAFGTSGLNTCYYAQLSDRSQYAGISTGDVIRLVNHSVTPDLSSFRFTVEEKKETAGISTMRLKPTVAFSGSQFNDANVVDGQESGYITIRNIFTIAKGRVGVI